MKTLTLNEDQVDVLINELGEIPAKYSYQLINKIKYNFELQNKPKEEEPDKPEQE